MKRHNLEIYNTTKATFPSLAFLSSNNHILKEPSYQIKVIFLTFLNVENIIHLVLMITADLLTLVLPLVI